MANTKIAVYFVNANIKCKHFELTSGLLCQEVLKECLEHISLKVVDNNAEISATKYLHMFGLLLLNSLAEEQVWLPNNHIFDRNKDQGQIYQFRVRFYPHNKRVNFFKLQSPDDVVFEYLFLQIMNDFLMGKLGGSDKIDDTNVLKLITISFLMPQSLPFKSSSTVDVHLSNQSIHYFNIGNKVSNFIIKRFSTWWIDSFWICRTVKTEIQKMKREKKLLAYYKQMFFTEVMTHEPYYWIEKYKATYNDGNKKTEVTLTVNFYELNNKPSLYFGEVMMYSLDELIDIKIECYNLDGAPPKTVLISPRNGATMSLEFAAKGAAESFVSMLQGFVMLFVSYDFCFKSCEFQTMDMKLRSQLQSFGYLSSSSITTILSSAGDTSRFLIHESPYKFGKYEVVVRHNAEETRLDIEIIDENRVKLFQNKTELKSCDRPALLHYLRNKYKIQRIPRNYPSMEEINKLFQLNIIEPYDIVHQPPASAEPVVYQRDQLVIIEIKSGKKPITKTEVSVRYQRMMLKSLQVEDPDRSEAFYKAVRDLCKLHSKKPESVLKFQGTVLERKPSFLMEFSPNGNLLDYLCQNQLTVDQKVDIIYQIVNILGFMQEARVFHGNLRSRKLFVFVKEGTLNIKIKLGDSGLSHYLDTLPLHEVRNIERLPWLSPERQQNLKSISLESECYAFGTIVVEIIYQTDNFLPDLNMSCMQNDSPLPQYTKLVTEEQNAFENQEDPLVPEAKKAIEDIQDFAKSQCRSREPADRPSIMKISQVISEIRNRTRRIRGDTEETSLRHFVYQVCPEAKHRLTSKSLDARRTKAELEEMLKKTFQNKFLPFHLITLSTNVLGQGFYGQVLEASIRTPHVNGQRGQSTELTKVAIKKLLQNDAVEDQAKNFVREICLACELEHPNIVKVLHFTYNTSLRIVDENFSNILLIMEYMTMGSLSSFAKNEMNSPDEPNSEILLNICIQIAEAMVYLSGKEIVHRDLAARNVLLTKVAGEIIAKVSDFGMARYLKENYSFYSIKPKELLPIFWMPPEALDQNSERQIFTSKGDVWSYGVTVWEAFSQGKHPKEELPHQFDQLLCSYKHHKRLPKGPHISDSVYNILQSCWHLEPSQRPAFVELVPQLKALKAMR
ncbi:tyrosine-protein kinase JAK2-like [Biomphalaria glabrata]|uniref:Tyrosine-protein kinase JAK2-like n=1 Tax=Biomphalaria glabrata TaxID=6526 RepID=A0A9W3BIK1_BIOGL|nr:tyrosine-protein kinase JAK2-like [Biomphalaria glabrata]XP_055899363.1 tyrosine-protein kinase JAK2-like [Biomphalaria glabrata]XP_055899364.1 tyrosine-protein kinase JAK2-like [Biomphalaria glabrata]